MCKCKVCNRGFLYGDCQSPMLSEKVWKRVVDFYNLSEYEQAAEKEFARHYDRTLALGKCMKEKDDEHLFICYVCVEKALGRRIRRSDLIGKDVLLNRAFERMYFGE